LRIETDVSGALKKSVSTFSTSPAHHRIVIRLGGPYHSLGCESLDLLNGAWCPLLEGHTMKLYQQSALPSLHHRFLSFDDRTYSLVQVDGVFSGDNVGDGRSLLARGLLSGGLGRHF
jgi:hypothetical protein